MQPFGFPGAAFLSYAGARIPQATRQLAVFAYLPYNKCRVQVVRFA